MAATIVKLPDAVANQIAAGEVVERPVAVVKELVENALDAGSRAIEIQFEKGGKSLIRVLDDGIGMSREDALLALERHATSKIREVAGILRIGSFGFRGEALPSIASVCRFTLRTRQRGATEGTEIRVNGGKSKEVSSCGMPSGTEVVVANLFHSVPARRKFMKTDRTEAAHILQMCRLLAVAHPEVGFSLIEDGHEVFRTPPCPDRAQRIREIFGRQRVEDLIPLEFKQDGIRVGGLVGRPGVGRSTRAEMITFVNLRPVESRVLNYALIESYHRYLPRGRYPMAFLFVDLPAGDVDVNVHPTKREVRFRAEPVVRSAVMSGLHACLAAASRPALRKAEPVEPIEPVRPENVPPATPAPAIVPASHVRPIPPSPSSLSTPAISPVPEPQPPVPAPEAARPQEPDSALRPIWAYCGAFRQRIGLFEGADGLVLLNARAARERILLERIEDSLSGATMAAQQMLIPPMLERSPLEAGIRSENLSFLACMGFELEPFGRHLFRLRAVPAWLDPDHAEAFVGDVVHKIRERGIRPDELESPRTWIARMAALREARGYRVTGESQWAALADQLLKCRHPLLDARDRPTFVEIRNAELARKLMLDGGGESSHPLDDPA